MGAWKSGSLIKCQPTLDIARVLSWTVEIVHFSVEGHGFSLTTKLWWSCFMQVVVPEGLTVRVINHISKKAEVKSRFHDIFKAEGYPDAFPFGQKVSDTYILKLTFIRALLYCWRSWNLRSNFELHQLTVSVTIQSFAHLRARHHA